MFSRVEVSGWSSLDARSHTLRLRLNDISYSEAFTWCNSAAQNMPRVPPPHTTTQVFPTFSLLLIWLRAARSYQPSSGLSPPYSSSCLSPSPHPLFSCLFYCTGSSEVFFISDPTKMTSVVLFSPGSELKKRSINKVFPSSPRGWIKAGKTSGILAVVWPSRQ